MNWLLYKIFALLMVFIPFLLPAQSSLSINLKDLKGYDSCVGIALYDENGFLVEEKSLFNDYLCKSEDFNSLLLFKSFPSGEYALAVFEDLNGNRKLDKNITGIPTEPYVFSNNSGSKWSKPSFEDASFILVPGDNQLSLSLRFWKDY